MNEFGGKRLETNGPYLINNDQRQILPLFRECSFTCCIFHGLSNIGIDALASSSSAILHLPPINYASKPNHRATRLINNESRNSGEERSMESIFRNRDHEQQIRELSRVDSRRSEFSKREHIDEFFHRRIGIPLRDFVLKLFKNIARNRNSCGTCKFVCSKINFPLVDPPSPPLINIFDDGSSHFPRDEFSKLTVWQKLWNRVWHDPRMIQTNQQRVIQLIDVILQLCFSKSSTRGGKKNNIVFDYESRILFFFFTFQWTDKLTEIFFLRKYVYIYTYVIVTY